MKSPTGAKLLVIICLLTTCLLDGSCGSKEVGLKLAGGGAVGREEEVLLCGESFPVAMSDAQQNQSAKIIQGQYALPGEFPHQVFVGQHQWPDCGGLLISSRFVLTAAHCISKDETIFVYLGAHNFTRPGITRVWVSDRVIHPLYEEILEPKYLNRNDIALLKLAEPVRYSLTKTGYGSINRICLPGQPDSTIEDAPVIISGWGRLDPEGWIPEALKKANLVVVKHSTCAEKYEKRGNYTLPNEDTQICAGDWNLDQIACHGDSGGALIRTLEDGRYELLGLLSYGTPECNASEGVPDVYTRVSYYLDWIIDTAGSFKSD